MQTVYPGFPYKVKNATMKEDCLSLNIYVPTAKYVSRPLPVMFWSLEGGYVVGRSSEYDGSYLAQKEVIVVTFNYRLNAFGFMSTEDDVMPGNYGMLDQVAALKWVNTNIAAFGGDPKQITIFGESSGAGSVSLMTMSPLTKGLFQRAIIESGSALSSWSSLKPGYSISAKVFARLIATRVGCMHLDDTIKLLHCLQNIDADALLNATSVITVALSGKGALLPRIETTFNFLPDSPINLVSSGRIHHVDTLRGYMSDEMGSIFNIKFLPGLEMGVVPVISAFLQMMTTLDRSDLVKMYTAKYVTNGTDAFHRIQSAFKAGNDIGFIAPTVTELNYFTQKASEKRHFLYEFKYRPSYSTMPKWMNAGHRDDIPFVFGFKSYPAINTTRDDISVSDQIIERWTNFAKTGNPSSNGGTVWTPYTPTSPNYLVITTKSEQMQWARQYALDLYSIVLQKLDDWAKPGDDSVG